MESQKLVDSVIQEEIVQKIIRKEITTEDYRAMLKKFDKRVKELSTDFFNDLLSIHGSDKGRNNEV
jgi:hypothetical protein